MNHAQAQNSCCCNLKRFAAYDYLAQNIYSRGLTISEIKLCCYSGISRRSSFHLCYWEINCSYIIIHDMHAEKHSNSSYYWCKELESRPECVLIYRDRFNYHWTELYISQHDLWKLQLSISQICLHPCAVLAPCRRLLPLTDVIPSPPSPLGESKLSLTVLYNLQNKTIGSFA